MKKYIIIFAFAGFLVSCKQEKQADLQASDEPAALASVPMAKEGFGKVQLKCGSQLVTVEGKCGGTTALGYMVVAVQDKTVAAKVFTITFNSKDYPENGKIYTIKKSDFLSETKRPVSEIYVAFSEVTSKSMTDWSSDDQTGTIQFNANGNEIKCTFKDLKLQPSEVYNKGELNQVATASGEMTFYKN